MINYHTIKRNHFGKQTKLPSGGELHEKIDTLPLSYLYTKYKVKASSWLALLKRLETRGNN